MKLLIIGGGIGGLTTALACQHFNLDYEVYEAAPEIREVGAGIWVPPNAMQVMKRLDMTDQISQEGKLLDYISVGGPKGDVWHTVETEKVISKFGFGTIAIHRARLQALLYHAIDKNKVHIGKRLKSFTEEKGKVTAFFEDGSQAEGDCLIGADGLRSVVRKQLFGEQPLCYSGQSCWRGIVKFQLPEKIRGSMFELWGKLSGQRFAYSQIREDEVYFYATLAVPSGGKDDLSTLKNFLHQHYDTYGTLVQNIIDAIDPSAVIRTDLFDLKPMHTWNKGRIALLGDAAHATTPNLGQGAAQAIEDAYVLISELKNGTSGVETALQSYRDKRIKKAHHIVNTSWKFGQITNIGNPAGVAIRNWVIRSTPAFIADRQVEKAYRIDF